MPIPREYIPGDRSWYLLGYLENSIRTKFLVDSGATHSMIPKAVFDLIEPRPILQTIPATRNKVTGFNGETSSAIGECTLTISLPGRDLEQNFLVLDAQCTCILGIDFMDRMDIQLSLIHI